MKFIFTGTLLLIYSLGVFAQTSTSIGVMRVVASATELALTVRGVAGEFEISELTPFQTVAALTNATMLVQTNRTGDFTLKLSRFEGVHDRLYSGFVASQRVGTERGARGEIHFTEELETISTNQEPLPKTPSKKGIQVQMVDDALALGIKHCTINLNLAGLIQLTPKPDSLTWQMDGETYYFNRKYLEAQPIKRLSDAGVVVNLIVLYYTGAHPELDAIMQHPHYSPSAPNHLTAFNTATPVGLRYFKATMEFLADYFSRRDAAHGLVWGYIIGNEVNAHWEWYNLGAARVEDIAEDYLRTVRVAHTAVRKASANARVYLSFTHFWTQVMQKNPQHYCGGKELLDEFAKRAKAGGDFDWHLAHHPYPENLFEPRTWLDKSAVASSETPKITFKNLEILTQYFQRPEMLYHGKPRRAILSEQGFHCANTPNGEALQAAAYCYAWEKVQRLDGIDAFILHRHVDHRAEGGLSLGLWSRKPDSVATADRPRQIYEIFRAADTPERPSKFEFALPIIGLTNWNQVMLPER